MQAKTNKLNEGGMQSSEARLFRTKDGKAKTKVDNTKIDTLLDAIHTVMSDQIYKRKDRIGLLTEIIHCYIENNYNLHQLLCIALHHKNKDNKKLLLDVILETLIATKRWASYGDIIDTIVCKKGYTILHDACSLGEPDFINYLISKKVSINNANNASKLTPLHIACTDDANIETVKLLIHAGANLKEDSDNWTPLHKASRNGCINLCTLLIEKHGADMNATGKDKITPLMLAVMHNQKKMVEWLLEKAKTTYKEKSSFEEFINQRDSNGNTLLILACAKNNYEIAKLLIDHGADASIASHTGEKPLMAACNHRAFDTLKEENSKLVTLILEHDTEIDKIKDVAGSTSLMIACKNGLIDAAEMLLAKGANVHVSTDDGIKPITLAARYGYSELFKLLLTKYHANAGPSELMTACKQGHYVIAKMILETSQIDLNQLRLGTTPLINACQSGNGELVRLLLSKGASANLADSNGKTPLAYAVEYAYAHPINIHSHWGIMRLIEGGANINEKIKDTTLLMHAVNLGRTDFLNDLITSTNGVAINEKDRDGKTAFMLACQHGHQEIAALLIKAGAHINDTDNEQLTALHLACLYGKHEIINLLLSKEVNANHQLNVNAKDDKGRTPLMFLCSPDELRSAMQLIIAGADVHAQNMDGNTPLMIASKLGNLKLVTFLLLTKEAKANEVDLNGQSALLFACQYGYYDIAKRLIDSRAQVNQKDNLGQTALMIACAYGHEKIVRLLLEAKANVNETEMDGKTPLYFAYEYGQKHIIPLLIEKDAAVNTALITGIQLGNIKVVNQLIALNSTLNVLDTSGFTFLHYACLHDQLEITKLLIQKGADIHRIAADGTTPLYLACKYGHLEIFELLSRGNTNEKAILDFLVFACKNTDTQFIESFIAHPQIHGMIQSNHAEMLFIACKYKQIKLFNFLIKNTSDQFLMNTLAYACQKGQLNVLQGLLDAISMEENRESLMRSIFNQTNTQGETLLTLACKKEKVNILKFLVEQGADINLLNHLGQTPLHIACEKGNSAIMILLLTGKLPSEIDQNKMPELLINTRLNINARNHAKEDALYIACKSGRKSMIEFLILAGADTTHALILACQNGDTKTIVLLRELGIDTTRELSEQGTLFHHACLNKDKRMIAFLLRTNFDIRNLDIENREGKTALDIACEMKDKEIAQMLADHGATVKTTNASSGLIDISNPKNIVREFTKTNKLGLFKTTRNTPQENPTAVNDRLLKGRLSLADDTKPIRKLVNQNLYCPINVMQLLIELDHLKYFASIFKDPGMAGKYNKTGIKILNMEIDEITLIPVNEKGEVMQDENGKDVSFKSTKLFEVKHKHGENGKLRILGIPVLANQFEEGQPGTTIVLFTEGDFHKKSDIKNFLASKKVFYFQVPTCMNDEVKTKVEEQKLDPPTKASGMR